MTWVEGQTQRPAATKGAHKCGQLIVGSGAEPVHGRRDSLVHEECWRPGHREARTRTSTSASHFIQKLDSGLKSKTVRLLEKKNKPKSIEDLQGPGLGLTPKPHW